jgi:hypothetical protein
LRFLTLHKEPKARMLQNCHSVVTAPGIGIQRSDSLDLFAVERKSGFSRQGFETLLPGKKHPKLQEIFQIWATFGTKNFFASFSALVLFCAFIRLA